MKLKIIKDRNRRVKLVNQLIGMINTRGCRFFVHKGFEAVMIYEDDGFLYWIDEHTGKAVNLNRGNWGYWENKISHGGTLRSLIERFRNFVMDGSPMQNDGLFKHWGYSNSEMEDIKSKAVEFGILKAYEPMSELPK